MKQKKLRNWSASDIELSKQTTTLTAQLHGLSCPRCENRKLTKNGTEKGNQRYKCNKCGKNLRDTTGHTIHHLHLKPKIKAYIDCMNQGLSLRKTATQLGISVQTAFRWRHRFLLAMQKQPRRQQFSNKVISAYTLPYSTKGSPKPNIKQPNITSILKIDTTGQTTINVLGHYGKTKYFFAENQQAKTLHMPSKSIPRICKQNSHKCTSPHHFQQTNNAHSQITEWLGAFRGVATKYLENYWKWFEMIRELQLAKSGQKRYLYSCL